jgi:hypothetical protein
VAEVDEHYLRMVAAGALDVEIVRAPRPPGISGPALRVLEFFELVVAVRRWAGLSEPYEVLFARGFVARWTGLPKRAVGRALAELQRPSHPLGGYGLLAFVREMPPRGQPHGTFVFAPGWLVDAEELSAPGGVVAGGPEDREEVAEDQAVLDAVAVDGREAVEGDGGLAAVEADAGSGSHGGDYNPAIGVDDCPF